MHYLLTWMMSIMLASSSPSGSLCINTAPHLLRGGVEASRKRGLPPSPQGLPLWSAESSSCNQDIRIMKNIEILGKYWIYTQNSTWRTKLKFSNLDTFPCWILSIFNYDILKNVKHRSQYFNELSEWLKWLNYSITVLHIFGSCCWLTQSSEFEDIS